MSYFGSKLEEAVNEVQKILDTTRNPKLPSEVIHKYEDKFLLAEFITNSALAAQLNVLRHLNFNDENLKKMKKWSDSNKT
ncbi:hypothetical protein HDU92_000287, partial [Lobulomyces angularis]